MQRLFVKESLLRRGVSYVFFLLLETKNSLPYSSKSSSMTLSSHRYLLYILTLSRSSYLNSWYLSDSSVRYYFYYPANTVLTT